MEISFLFLCLLMDGVSAGVDTDEVKSIQVILGDSVTLNADVTDIQTDDVIVWSFGPGNDRIAQINIGVKKVSIYDDVLDGRFRHRLILDRQTGSLTIMNTTTTDFGLYEVGIIRGSDVISRRFSVVVTARLPVPVITSNCSSSPSSCVFVCSVMNVSHVTLSWYKGNSLLSSISASDLIISLSLSLEVEYHHTNTYSCVINNPITNITQHLNITDEVCQPCSELMGVNEEKDTQGSHLTVLIGGVVVVVLVVGVAVMIFCFYKRFAKTDQDGQTSGEELAELNGRTPGASDAAETETTTPIKDGVKNIKVKAGSSFKLDTGVTDIQSFDLIQWKFGEAGDITNPFIPISRIMKNNEETVNNRVIKKLGDRLKLNKETGSITVENSRITDTGFYKLEINSDTDQICKSFIVTVRGASSFCKCNSQYNDDL